MGRWWRKSRTSHNAWEKLQISSVITLLWSPGAPAPPALNVPMDCSLPGSSGHGIFQARILEWVAMSFSRGSSQPRNWTGVSCIAGRFFTNWVTREAPTHSSPLLSAAPPRALCPRTQHLWSLSLSLFRLLTSHSLILQMPGQMHPLKKSLPEHWSKRIPVASFLLSFLFFFFSFSLHLLAFSFPQKCYCLKWRCFFMCFLVFFFFLLLYYNVSPGT